MAQCQLGEGSFPLHPVQGFSISSCYLVSWGLGLLRSPRVKAFALLETFPLGCNGAGESWVIPQMHEGSLTPSLMQPPAAATTVFRWGSEDLSYPIPAPLRGAAASLPSVMWLLWLSQDFWAFRVFSVGIWLLLFVVCWRGESPGQAHSTMTLWSHTSNIIYWRYYHFPIVPSWCFCRKSIDHTWVGLFLAFLLCSIDMGVCYYAQTTLFWLL